MLKKLFAKIKEMNTVRGTICHYTAHFTTTDGKEHSFNKYRYGAPDKLKCSVPEYIMIDVKSDGYLKDMTELCILCRMLRLFHGNVMMSLKM